MSETLRTEETSTKPDSGPRRIVVGVDASDNAEKALQWAANYASTVGATLDVIHAWHLADEFAWIQPLPPPAGETDVAEKALDRLIQRILGKNNGLIATQRVIHGQPAKVLVRESTGADMLVIGSRGLGDIAGTLLGSVSRACASHANCTVVIVR